MKLESRGEERDALAFLKWFENKWTLDDLPMEVLHVLYCVEDSVVRR